MVKAGPWSVPGAGGTMSDFGPTTGDLVTATEAGAIEAVAAQAAERLAGICAGWPPDRFRALVLDVARVRLHFGIPRAEFESLLHAQASAPAPPADVSPPMRLPPATRGFPAFPDRPASAPT
jgi:hypothetical protein